MNRMEKEAAANKSHRQQAFSPYISLPVLVTTELRGVFFGYLDNEEKDEHGNVTVKLSNARNCLHWSADVHGFMGLASAGPTTSCRIGPSVPSIKLTKVSSIIEATPQAAEAWERGPWGR